MTTAVAAVPRERLLAHLSMLAFSALIAGSFTTGALAVPYIHPIPLNAVRFLLAAAMMGAVAFGLARNRFAFPSAPWRFGIMGYSCKMENVMLSLCALETVFADLGIAVEFGAAEAAAYRAYASIPNKVQSLRAVAA